MSLLEAEPLAHWTLIGGDFAPQEPWQCLVTVWSSQLGGEMLLASKAAEHPIMRQKPPLEQRIIQPKISIVLRLENCWSPTWVFGCLQPSWHLDYNAWETESEPRAEKLLDFWLSERVWDNRCVLLWSAALENEYRPQIVLWAGVDILRNWINLGMLRVFGGHKSHRKIISKHFCNIGLAVM